MMYEIVGIYHSGTKGERNEKRMEKDYRNRIGRKVDINLDEVYLDRSLIIPYIFDSNGDNLRGKYLATSKVMDICYKLGTSILRIETMNSIFEFEKVEHEFG